MPRLPASPSALRALAASTARLAGGAPSGFAAGADAARAVALGAAEIDARLGGGLARAAVHEVFPASGADQPAASGFALGLLARAAATAPEQGAPLVWVRQDALSAETGRPYGPGLADWGLDPGRFLLVRARSAEDVLRAAGEAARTAGLGGVLVETYGEDKRFDLTASRRLALRAEAAGAPVFFVRIAAEPAPSAAATRWRVRAAASRPLVANAPGAPAFEVEVLRRRGGAAGWPWRLQWSRDDGCFSSLEAAAAAPARPLGPLPADRPRPPIPLRRAG